MTVADNETQGLSIRLGLSIRDRREQLGRSQANVAASVGRTQAWLSYVEAGKREPRLADLDALLRELGMALTITTPSSPKAAS